MTAVRLVEQALELSRADGCVVLVAESDSANLRWANNTLTTNGVAEGRRVTVISTIGGASGTAAGVLTRTGVDAEGLADLVLASEHAAREGGPMQDAMPLLPGTADPGWDAEPAHTSMAVFAELAPALGEAFETARAEGHVLFGYADHEVVTTYLGTSTGIRRRHAQPTGSLHLNAKSADFSRSAYVGLPAPDPLAIDLRSVREDLAQRLDWAKRSIDLPAGRYPTLLPPGAVGDLFAYAYWIGLSARHATEGRSVFSRPGGGTRVGEQLCGDSVRLTLTSDPGDPRVACAPFVIGHSSGELLSVFDNGLPLAPTDWIQDGRLATLITTRHTAEQTGHPLAPPIDNLIMTATSGGSGRSLAEMIAGTERALLPTCLWYIRVVDPQTLLLTGLTRDGVYLVENGEVTGVVNNFRFNESPIDLLRRVSEAGSAERCLGREFGEDFNRTAMPALRIDDFNMSSVSQAS